MRPTTTSPEAKVPDTAPLDESEINRLILAARAETYRPSEAAPRTAVESFRPKSLLELARLPREADQVDQVDPADASDAGTMPETAAALPDTGGAGDSQLPEEPPGQDPGADWGLAPEPPMAAPEPVSRPPGTAADRGAGDAAAALPGDDLGQGAQDLAPAAPKGAVGVPVDGAAAGDPDTLEQIRSEAHAAGRAEAEAEARAHLTAATEILEAVAQALRQPGPDALAGLRAEITQAVLSIASERAGLEIDTMPDAFVERIEALAERIHSRATQPVLRLHPDDLAAITPLIQNSDSLSGMRILASDDLARGDVDLAVDGLRMSDRILGQPAPRKSARTAPKPRSDET
jgi:flagellar assembly protein FliH